MNETNTPIDGTTRRHILAHCTALLALSVVSGLAVAPARAAAAAAAEDRILVVGDSLSAEYGLGRGSGWVAILERRLAQEGRRAVVVNASISGDTTAGGRSRLPALLREKRPTLVVIELGANDALRGLPLDTTKANLAAMARAARAAGARVVLVGMQLPPNYGRKYGAQFEGMYGEVAREERTALVPFMLKGVADAPNAEALFQPDRIHPVAAAHPTIFANIWPVLEPSLAR